VRIESSVTSVTWIPSEAIKGMPKLPFELGVAHYDEPPPDVIDDLDALRERDAFREANELKAFVEVRDGRIVDYGYRGRALIGKTRLRLGPKEMSFAAVKYPVLQEEPEVGSDWVRFQQTAGGHMGLPAPRRVRGRPFFRIASASAWTTLQLVLYADGTSRGTLKGASPFPRHWVYDKDGKLMEKSATIDFAKWWRESHGERTPWGEEDSPALVTAVESEVERELSWQLMRGREKLPRREIATGRRSWSRGSRAGICSCCSTARSTSRWTARWSVRWARGRSWASARSSRAARVPPRCGPRRRAGWRCSPSTRSTTRRCASSPPGTGARNADRHSRRSPGPGLGARPGNEPGRLTGVTRREAASSVASI